MNAQQTSCHEKNIQIGVEGRIIGFRLDQENWRWHSLEVQEEGVFPLITVIDGKRLELYSDGTYAEVER
jgi:hypothetical protein